MDPEVITEDLIFVDQQLELVKKVCDDEITSTSSAIAQAIDLAQAKISKLFNYLAEAEAV